MNRDALLLYLRDLRDLEFAKKKLEVIYNNEKQRYEREIYELSKNNLYQVPEEESGWNILRILGIGFFGILSIAILCGLIFGTVYEYDSFVGHRVKVPIRETGLGTFFSFGLMIFLIAICLIWANAVQETKENKELIETVKKNNADEMLRVEKNEELSTQLQAQWIQCSEYLTEEYRKVNSLLESNYGLNILANPYRNLASVYYIYDYMSSSHENLKDTLIHEHMENGIQRILAKLDRIIQQQQEIIFQTRVLESQNNTIIDQNKRMLDSLQRIENDAMTAAQYSEIAANYSKASAYFGLANYLRG